MRKTTLTAGVLGTVLSFSAAASPYSDFYVFGDSLYDAGNFGVRFTNRVGPDYQTSPFGSVSPMLVGDILGVSASNPSVDGGSNYAVGGNQSEQTLQSITADGSYVSRAGPSFNSLFYDLEASGRSFDSNALYLLDGGGNDIRAFVSPDVVSTNMVAAANALVSRGAKYVVVANVPDLGIAPAGVGFGDYATGQAALMNEGIRQQIGGSNILIMDAFSFIGEVAVDPMKYGVGITAESFSYAAFDDDCSTCTDGNPEAKIDGSNPDPDQFFFNDGLHPTTIGQQISADYLLSILRAPGELALLPEMGLDDMRAHWRAAQPVMRGNRWHSSTAEGKYTVWGGLSGSEEERDTSFGDTGTNEVMQYNMGFNYRFNENLYLGAMLSRADNELDFDDSSSSYDMQSLDFSLLSGLRGERWFVEGILSYSDLDYDELKRGFNLGTARRTERGDTKGESLGFLVNAGYNLMDSAKSYRLGPMLGYDYVNVEVDGYTEKESRSTALVVDDQKAITGIWNAGLFGDIQLGFCECVLYSEAVYRSFDRDDSINPRVGLVTVPGNGAVLPGYERDDDGWRWDVGLSATLGKSVELNIGGGIDDADNTEGFWAGGQVSYSF
jgi:outer membrane lipase/esterase